MTTLPEIAFALATKKSISEKLKSEPFRIKFLSGLSALERSVIEDFLELKKNEPDWQPLEEELSSLGIKWFS